MKMYRILQKDADSSSDALVATWFRTKQEVHRYVKNHIKNHIKNNVTLLSLANISDLFSNK